MVQETRSKRLLCGSVIVALLHLPPVEDVTSRRAADAVNTSRVVVKKKDANPRVLTFN